MSSHNLFIYLFILLSWILNSSRTSSQFSLNLQLLFHFVAAKLKGLLMDKGGRCQSVNQCGGFKYQREPSLVVVKELGGSDRFLDNCYLQVMLAELFWRDDSFLSPSCQDSDAAVRSSAGTEKTELNTVCPSCAAL